MSEQVYISQADIYCQECGEAIKAKLDGAGETPANPSDEATFDSDNYPKGPYDDGGGEADAPQHCASCQKPLLNDLTTDGVKYVIEALKEYKHYEENGETLDGWADQLDDYSLDDEQKKALDAYRELRKVGEDITIKFVNDCEVEIVDSYDEKLDHVESHNEVFAKNQIVEATLIDDHGETVDLQFADGCMLYKLQKKCYVVVE